MKIVLNAMLAIIIAATLVTSVSAATSVFALHHSSGGSGVGGSDSKGSGSTSTGSSSSSSDKGSLDKPALSDSKSGSGSSGSQSGSSDTSGSTGSGDGSGSGDSGSAGGQGSVSGSNPSTSPSTSGSSGSGSSSSGSSPSSPSTPGTPSGPIGTTPPSNSNIASNTAGSKGATLKGQIQQQICQGAGDIVSVQCQQILNVKNIHTTTVKGSNIRIGAPGVTSSGASPVVLYIPDTGYVELTGVHNIGAGEATISYIVLVPAK